MPTYDAPHRDQVVLRVELVDPYGHPTMRRHIAHLECGHTFDLGFFDPDDPPRDDFSDKTYWVSYGHWAQSFDVGDTIACFECCWRTDDS